MICFILGHFFVHLAFLFLALQLENENDAKRTRRVGLWITILSFVYLSIVLALCICYFSEIQTLGKVAYYIFCQDANLTHCAEQWNKVWRVHNAGAYHFACISGTQSIARTSLT